MFIFQNSTFTKLYFTNVYYYNRLVKNRTLDDDLGVWCQNKSGFVIG